MSDYTPSGAPATSSSGDSATMRAEFQSIQTAVNSKVDRDGALGTPTSGTATNLTGTAAGLTAGTANAVAVGGITGLGTGVATALAVNVGSAGAPVVNGGALGTPASGTATNLTGTASGLTAGAATVLANARTIDGISFNGSANITVVAEATHAATSKATPVDADKLGIWDSVSGVLNGLTWANLKATLKTYFDTLYSAAAAIYAAKGANTDITSLGNLTSVGTVTTIDINGGTIDGVTIGGAAPGNATFAAMSCTGSATLGDAVGDTHSVNGALSFITAAVSGYGTGAGGTVTQATDKSTSVTLNKPCGQITMNNASLAAGAIVGFACNNSLVAATDTIVCNQPSFANTSYNLWARPLAGQIGFALENRTGGALTDAVVINFAVIKGAAS